MDQFLKPERFDVDPTCTGAEAKWKHWKRTFTNFIDKIPNVTDDSKLPLLFNYISAAVFVYINDAVNYNDAIGILDSLYVIRRNEIFARHCLASRSQQTSESVAEYLQILKQLSKDCAFKPVTADQYKNEYIRDAFIRGLKSPRIRERLLENTTISLNEAFDQARALELAELNSASYLATPASTLTAAAEIVENAPSYEQLTAAASTWSRSGSCFFCGNNRHPRNDCPAKNAICRKCGKKGHFQKVCKSKQHISGEAASAHILASLSSAPSCLQKSIITVTVNGVELQALIDTGSSLSFINLRHVTTCQLKMEPYTGKITMANSTITSEIAGRCIISITFQGHLHNSIEVLVMKDLCADFLIGHDLLKNHSSLIINFSGKKPPLEVCALAIANVSPVSLFTNLTPDCKPVITKSRRHSVEDQEFITAEVKRLLKEGIIEPSHSSWRAQAFVIKGENRKPRMVIDYSQTVNKFTMLDAYPLPKIEELISRISKYKIFSRIDLKNAYHQVPIINSERHFTAFEADGKLYQFRRVPFGVTNGVACFQRTIDTVIEEEQLKDTFPYLDDVTVGGRNQEEHDRNLENFFAAAKKYNLTLNEEKCVYSAKSIALLGYIVENKTIRPDPDRLAPLMNLPVPVDTASLQRALGMFAHYCRWIPSFSAKIRPLLAEGSFPLSEKAVTAFNFLKNSVANATLAAIEDNVPFRVETDASDFAIGATLSQAGRPIAFFSRTLNQSEQRHSSIEKEAYAIVESLRYWRHYLIGRHFEVFTDQRSVAFMFDQQHRSKIKNEKIMRWRLELACFKYDIVYRPGSKNSTADALSRISAAITSRTDLMELHVALCHPGITRMVHWVRSKNLPFSVEEVKKTIGACLTCHELKPCFHKNKGTLIKATAPFERLNLDFKGPLPSTNKNRFLLTIVDEYSRYPFAVPCSDISTSTVISSLQNIFSLFGMPAYIHSDRGSSFMSNELKSFLTSQGIATSRTTAYNPAGNGQVERYNGIIWKTIELALKSRGLSTQQWAQVLQPALHSIRSLLCTATNATPHERMFTHVRRSHNGCSLPTWLSTPGPVLMKNHCRGNKYEPLVQEVELIEANPEYAHVKLPDGRETSVSLRHLAPRGDSTSTLDTMNFTPMESSQYPCLTENIMPLDVNSLDTAGTSPVRTDEESEIGNMCKNTVTDTLVPTNPIPRRIRRPPEYLKDYVVKY